MVVAERSASVRIQIVSPALVVYADRVVFQMYSFVLLSFMT